MRFMLIAGSILLLSNSTSHADRVAADRCAAALPPASRSLYEASLAEVLGGELPRDALAANGRAIVMDGSLPRGNARPAAVAAGSCLQQVMVGVAPGVGVTPRCGVGAPGVGVTEGYGFFKLMPSAAKPPHRRHTRRACPAPPAPRGFLPASCPALPQRAATTSRVPPSAANCDPHPSAERQAAPPGAKP